MQQMFFIADLIACSTCFGHHYVHHQELESIIQLVAACGLWGFSSSRYGVVLRVVCPVCGLLVASSWHFISTHTWKSFSHPLHGDIN
jgi:hypothetical protein